jgi:hypothetical protein
MHTPLDMGSTPPIVDVIVNFMALNYDYQNNTLNVSEKHPKQSILSNQKRHTFYLLKSCLLPQVDTNSKDMPVKLGVSADILY